MHLEKMISNFETVIDFAKRNGNASGFVFVDDLQATVDFLKQQMPKVMTYGEVKMAGESNEYEFYDDKIRFVWLEIRDKKIHLVRPVYDYHPELGDEGYYDSVLIDYVGCNFDEQFFENEYCKTWRCWTKCPTEEQRKAAKWDD